MGPEALPPVPPWQALKSGAVAAACRPGAGALYPIPLLRPCWSQTGCVAQPAITLPSLSCGFQLLPLHLRATDGESARSAAHPPGQAAVSPRAPKADPPCQRAVSPKP
jgi:hypothetical protein